MKRLLYFASVGFASGVAACFTTGFVVAALNNLPTKQHRAQRSGRVLHGKTIAEYEQGDYTQRNRRAA